MTNPQNRLCVVCTEDVYGVHIRTERVWPVEVLPAVAVFLKPSLSFPKEIGHERDKHLYW